jgi:uncharacterized protein YacL (UPF0231 family)
LTLALSLAVHGDGVPYTMYLKSASVEVSDWNLTNEVDSEKKLVGYYAKDKVCACGCSGRHNID